MARLTSQSTVSLNRSAILSQGVQERARVVAAKAELAVQKAREKQALVEEVARLRRALALAQKQAKAAKIQG